MNDEARHLSRMVSVSGQFTIFGDEGLENSNLKVVIEAANPLSGNLETTATVQLDGMGLPESVTFSAANLATLGELIAAGEWTVNWSVKNVDANVTVNYGASKNMLYVTGANVNNQFETVLHIACTGAAGKRPANPGELAEDVNFNGILDPGEDTNNNNILDDEGAMRDRDVVDGVWNVFSGGSTRRANGTELKYSHENAVPPNNPGAGNSASEMLADVNGRGRCTAWAELFVHTLGVHGLAATSMQVLPPGGFNYLRVIHGPAQGTGGQDYAHTTFNFHQVVEVGVYPDRVFDPSYGGLPKQAAGGRSARLVYEDDIMVRYLFIQGGNIVSNIADTKGVQELIWQ